MQINFQTMNKYTDIISKHLFILYMVKQKHTALFTLSENDEDTVHYLQFDHYF